MDVDFPEAGAARGAVFLLTAEGLSGFYLQGYGGYGVFFGSLLWIEWRFCKF